MTAAGGLNAEGLDRIFADTRRALAAVRGDAPSTDAEPVEGQGSAQDDLLRVSVRAPGTVTQVHVDPRLMRLPSQELATSIAEAVNAALADLRTKVVVAADAGALQGDLTELHQQSIRELERFTSGLNAAVDQIRSRKG